MKHGKRWLAVWVAVLLALPFTPAMEFSAQAEGLVAQHGAFAALGDSDAYLILPSDAGASLYSVPTTGGALTTLDSASQLDDLILVDGSEYYLRYDGSVFQIAMRDASGTISTAAEFPGGAIVYSLSYYQSALYCLVDNKLNRVNIYDGSYAPVSDQSMSEYTIMDGTVYYVSVDDMVEYKHASLLGGDEIVQSAGKMYSMRIDGTGAAVAYDQGASSLKALGGYIYFHNMNDNYVMASSTEEWLEGRLYRMNVETSQLTAVLADYDWDFIPTEQGMVVYTSGKLSIGSLNGLDQTTLYEPEQYTSIAALGDSLLVYEHTLQKLTRIKLDGTGSQALYDGQGVASTATIAPEETISPEETIAPDSTDGEGVESSTTVKPTVKPTAKPTAKPSSSSSSYIFPKSNKKKLTRADILKVKSSLWAYGRNEIYARHGYKFKTKKFANYFAKKSWYKAGGFKTTDLNSIEWYNMKLIKQMEEELDDDKDSKQLLSASDDRKLTKTEIRKALDEEWWPYARNEILARHGYVFKTKKYANYFAKKSWYKPGGYSSSDLSSIEWYNIKLLKKMEAEG